MVVSVRASFLADERAGLNECTIVELVVVPVFIVTHASFPVPADEAPRLIDSVAEDQHRS